MGAYYPLQDPSGSSSGPGVVSSIGLAAAAVGTETSGSIISPASRNSLTGIKPVCPRVWLSCTNFYKLDVSVCRVNQQIPCCSYLADSGYYRSHDANNGRCGIYPVRYRGCACF